MSNPNPDRDERVRQIREQPPDSKVQCADCLTWINRDATHTCRQQVRRNQRSAAK